MRRWLPFPLLAAFLAAMWLVLNHTLAPGQILLAAVLALGGAWTLAALQAPGAGIRLSMTMARLFARVLADIVHSNAVVAWAILRPGPRRGKSGFVAIPLELHDPRGLAVLACIITATPGTCWAQYDSAAGLLRIHVLQLDDEAALVRGIKQRYEQPLLEIFQ
jgi:multicomponent K+:H+ antiporter subunit E